MLKTSFTLKTKQNPNEPTLITLYIKVNKEKLRLSTREKVRPKDWNDKEQRVKSQKTINDHKRINARLDTIQSTCIRVFEEMRAEGVPFTMVETKRRIEIALGWREEEKEVKYSLLDYLWFYARRKERRDGYEKAKTYLNTARKLDSFNPNLDWDDVDMQLYHRFKIYLEEEGLSKNTVGSHLNRIKTMINRARQEGKTDCELPRGWSKISEQTEAVALTDEEINSLYNLQLGDNVFLERVRDLFVIGCRSGLRSANYLNIDPKKDVIDGMLNISVVKGGGVVTIPLHWQVKEILMKYNWRLPKMTNQTLNRRIKEVARMANFNEPVKKQFTKGGQRRTDVKNKSERISSHTARRTYSTWLYLNGVLPAQIMLLTGHKSLTEFMKYIRISREQNAQQIAKMNFFQKPVSKKHSEISKVLTTKSFPNVPMPELVTFHAHPDDLLYEQYLNSYGE